MECQYVATQRGGVALVFEGHRYNKVRDGKDGTVYWRCSRDRQCPGRAVTVNNRVKKANNKHNHPPEAVLKNGTNAATAAAAAASSVVPNVNTSVNAQLDSAVRMQSAFTSLQDVYDAQNVAAAAAVTLPAIVTETLKYLAVASGNHQMAAFANSMASLSGTSLESLERTIGRPTMLAGGLTLNL
ncbi:hypothetical protein B4U80_08274 [Leptotrombidium deliense]|uniref:FLYWCH-type domain-containing protein n=1 Tax=Leptotrombidium deliense TaxID=299467 RepID=A0A443SEI9_9ACAR|nr:hypothetical protein B4U80_08274 [Leptotrombidium deliense]